LSKEELTVTSIISSLGFAERVVDALPLAVIATDLSGRVVLASAAARAALGGDACEGEHYERLPVPITLRRREMASPGVLTSEEGGEVRPVRAEDGSIIGAVQVLPDEGVVFDGASLCAAMAHELRNPLTGIQGFASLLQKDLQENDERRNSVRKIISGVQTVNETVSNMLDFCSSKPLATERVDPREVVATALELSGCADRLAVTVDVEQCDTIRCDRIQLQQALINLIRNAAEAMPDRGALLIAARRSLGAARIIIADEGCGMDAHTRANIFRPFFSTKRGGTGMGLAVVAKIVQQHNGEIAIESEPGEGTTITLTLPDSPALAPGCP
jgi:signal transduction histidine kinase